MRPPRPRRSRCPSSPAWPLVPILSSAAITVITIYTLLEIEYPRVGLIRIDPYVQLRAGFGGEVRTRVGGLGPKSNSAPTMQHAQSELR